MSLLITNGERPSNIELVHQVSSAPEGRPPANINTSDPNPALLSRTNPALLSRTILLDGAAAMYRATLQGHWPAAERLLAENPGLARAPITLAGDRALHVAVSMGHKEFVQNLVRQMSDGDIGTLLDRRGYTACCHATVSGDLEIARILREKSLSIVTSRDAKNVTLLSKAAFFGKKNMVQYFLDIIQRENLNLPQQEWFDILLTVINSKMFDVALKIVEMDGSLAHMRRNDEGTALHVLARLHVPEVQGETTLLEACFTLLCGRRTKIDPADSVMQQDIRLLAERLWAEILKLEQYDAIELMIKPSILHEAAERGNVELIIMLTQTYPELIWHRDDKGHSIFHIAVIHGRGNVFGLSYQIGTEKKLAEISQDGDGNTILHLAAQLSSATLRCREASPFFELEQKLIWFEYIRANVTPLCLNVRNKEGVTPGELFSKQHASLLEKSEDWMRRTAECGILIATIFLTIVFTALFTVPGGNNQETGVPILLKNHDFGVFSVFDWLAFVFSSLTILFFLSILTSRFEEEQFITILPAKLNAGFLCLLASFSFTFLVFTSAYFLVTDKRYSKAYKHVVILISLAVYVFISLVLFRLRISRRLFSWGRLVRWTGLICRDRF